MHRTKKQRFMGFLLKKEKGQEDKAISPCPPESVADFSVVATVAPVTALAIIASSRREVVMIMPFKYTAVKTRPLRRLVVRDLGDPHDALKGLVRKFQKGANGGGLNQWSEDLQV